MAFRFDVELEEDVCMKSKIEHVKKMADDSAYNIRLEGDDQEGKIRGIVSGKYTVDGSRLHINIFRKPIILSNGKIKETITEFFCS